MGEQIQAKSFLDEKEKESKPKAEKPVTGGIRTKERLRLKMEEIKADGGKPVPESASKKSPVASNLPKSLRNVPRCVCGLLVTLFQAGAGARNSRSG